MGGSSKPKKSVVGYRYFRSLNMGLCHGPIDGIRAVWIKDKVAWQSYLGRTNASKFSYIDQPGLFGGDDLEGGVQGWFEIGFGGMDQVMSGVNADGTTNVNVQANQLLVQNPYMPPRGTHYRGMVVVNFFDFYWGSNPYISDISFEIEAYWNGWYPEVAKIGLNANPAHIIYQCLTNDQWGLGYARDQLDDVAFRAAAAQLYNEALGLSQAWSETSSIEDFVNIIIEQIDGTFFFNQRNGKWTLRLIRAADPVVMTIGPGDARVTSFSRRVFGETINELTARWVNPETEEYQSITIHDQANIQATGQIISGSKDYPGVRTEALCAKLGLRDLRALSATLASAELAANRKAWSLNPGDLIDFVWPALDVNRIRMRVTTTTHVQESADINLVLIEDVFGQASASFNGDSPTTWVDPRQQPSQYSVLAGFELPYWYVFRASSGVTPAPEVTYGAVLPVSGNTNIISADLHALKVAPTSSQYVLVDSANATPSAILNADLMPEINSTAVLLGNSITGMPLIEPDTLAVIGTGPGAEIVRVVGSTVPSGTFQIRRGLMDTHPKRWPTGTRIFFIGETQFPADDTARSMAETVSYKVTMQTSLGKSLPADVPATLLPLRGRQGLPYPVANVRIEGSYWPGLVQVNDGALTVNFNTRNRLMQNSDIHVLWNEGSIVPEVNAEVLVFVIQGGVVVSSLLITDPTVNIAQLSVLGMESGPAELVVRTLRDDLENYQDFRHSFDLAINPETGWGADWDTDWGD